MCEQFWDSSYQFSLVKNHVEHDFDHTCIRTASTVSHRSASGKIVDVEKVMGYRYRTNKIQWNGEINSHIANHTIYNVDRFM